MEVRVTALIENNPDDKKELFYEHGLSLYIELEDTNLLFDTGQTGDFIKNSEKLKKSIQDLDYVVISHGHYDHSGGVHRLLATLNRKTEFVVGDEFFDLKYKKLEDGTYKFNGNSFHQSQIEEKGIHLRKIEEDTTYLNDRILIFHNFKRSNEYELRNERFFIQQGETYLPDDFKDEIALGILTSKGLVVVVGCSHVGIINILTDIRKRVNIPIYAVIGGTHLVEADEVRMNRTVMALKEMGIQSIAVSHCTGEEGSKRLSSEFGTRFIRNNTGNVIVI